MSWGIRITILYLSFVGLILTLVFLSSRQKVELVSKDYYEQELKYQNKIDAIKNINALSNAVLVTNHLGKVNIAFSEYFSNSKIKGTIYFFRPSDSSMDYKLDINPSANGIQTIETNRLIKGLYTLQISFDFEGKEYYKEESIFIE